MSRIKKQWLLALLGGLALAGCRAEQNTDMTEPFSASGADAVWYDMDGEGGECETPPAACAGFDYEKEFVDLCIEKNGRAKTCGCSMRCSTKIAYTRQKPKPGQDTKTDGDRTDPSAVCSDSERLAINKAAENRRPGSDEDRCIEDFLCQGTTARCQDAELAGANSLRKLARSGCSSEVYSLLCRNGFVDSLQCPEASIKQLSAVGLDLSDKNNTARRCTRNVLCFESEVGCDGAQKAQAQKYKALLNKDGCEYWLRKLCSLD
jgi:hypothetical protein